MSNYKLQTTSQNIFKKEREEMSSDFSENTGQPIVTQVTNIPKCINLMELDKVTIELISSFKKT